MCLFKKPKPPKPVKVPVAPAPPPPAPPPPPPVAPQAPTFGDDFKRAPGAQAKKRQGNNRNPFRVRRKNQALGTGGNSKSGLNIPT